VTSFGPALRSRWSLDPEVTFLNHGSFGACPNDVRAAQRRWQDALEAEPVRFFVDEAPAATRIAAGVVAGFLGADPDGLVFVDNATTGTGAVIGSFDWGPGDAVVTTSHAYGAVDRALAHHVARRGARVVHAPVPFPLSGPDEVVDAVTRTLAGTANVRLLVVNHVTSFSSLV
jgi:isopenicillin-N epimerase